MSEARQEAHEFMRDLAILTLPDVDPDAFAEAAIELAGAQGALEQTDITSWLEGAIEVGQAAKQRAEGQQ